MDYTYKSLSACGIFPEYAKPSLTEGAMAEVLTLLISLKTQRSYVSKVSFVFHYLLFYYVHVNLIETHMYILDLMDQIITEYDLDHDLHYQADKRFEVKFSKSQEDFMAMFENNVIHQEGYDADIGWMIYEMINNYNTIESKENQFRLLFELHTQAFLMRKHMIIGNRDGNINKIVYMPKYNRPKGDNNE
jgi:hypothetical protein